MTASASAIVCSGRQVTGSTIIPASVRFILSTPCDCAWIVMFLWITPMPPCCAIAIASRDSVTVSIAADTIGILREIPAVRRVFRSTSRGCTLDRAGRSRTSSNVRASGRSPSREEFRVFAISLGSRRCRPVALLVFFPGAAGARVVAADLGCVPLEGLDLRVLAAGGRGAVGVVDVAGASGGQSGGHAAWALRDDFALRLAHHRLEAEEILHELVLDALLHQREELKGFLLVLDERTAPAIARQPTPPLRVLGAQRGG